MSALSPGEITQGQIITVLEWAPREVPSYGLSFGSPVMLKTQDQSWVGEPLRVVGVQLPFVRVKELQGVLCNSVVTLDTRKCTLMELTKEMYEQPDSDA